MLFVAQAATYGVDDGLALCRPAISASAMRPSLMRTDSKDLSL